jgi:hypothetical protein
MAKWMQGVYTVRNKEKYAGNKPPRYRSSWEMMFCQFCDNNPSVLQWASESIQIPYFNPIKGRATIYIPDFFIVYVDKDGRNHAELIEIKPQKETTMEHAGKSQHNRLMGCRICILSKAGNQVSNCYRSRHLHADRQEKIIICMTKKLNDLFNLAPPNINGVEESVAEQEDQAQQLVQLLDAADKIDNALPYVKGLEDSDKELDELARKSEETFQSLIDLGMNMEGRFAAPVFEAATKMMGHAIAAKTAKMDKKLRMIDLQLKKAKLDQSKPVIDDDDGTMNSTGITMTRAELLEKILSGNK